MKKAVIILVLLCLISLTFSRIENRSSSKFRRTRLLGTVKYFDDGKGFGYIYPDGGGKDVFIHHSNINTGGFRTLSQGQRVSYELVQGSKGPEAQNVQIL